MKESAARLTLVALMLMSAAPATTQKVTFSAKVEAVRVDVLVTDNGQPVRGLRPADFQVLDNGVEQRIDLASFEQIPLNVVLALDASDSVRGERLDHLRAAGRALIAGLVHGDQAALITFNQTIRLGCRLTADLDRAREAIEQIAPGGSTALVDATYTGMVLGESDVGRTLLIVFTDGADTTSFLRRQQVVEAAKRTSVVLYGAAVARRGRPKFLSDVADETGGRVLEVDSTGNLAKAFVGILDEFRQRYLLSYSPRGVATGGWHRLAVRVRGRRVQVKARPGYIAAATSN